jgi:small subunit ribosomal protein S13
MAEETKKKERPKGEPKGAPKAAPKAEPKGAPKAAPKAEPKGAPKGAPKVEPKKEPKGQPKEDLEFKHIVRILDTDLTGTRGVVHALCGVKGIGWRVARIIVLSAGVNPNAKLGNLSEEEIERLKSAIEGVEKRLPWWMLNRRKDILSGEDKHLMGADQVIQLREDINLLRKIRSYRGIRHERGLKARGQRTKSTGRKGMVVGVIRKKLAATTAKPGEKK